MSFNLLDAGFGILLILFLVRGLLRGLVQEIAGFVGIFLGFFLSGRFYPQVAPQFKGIIDNPDWAAGAAYALIFAVTLLMVALAAAVFRKFLNLAFASWLDYLLGAVVGAAKGLLICAIALAVLRRLVPKSHFLVKSAAAAHISSLADFAHSLLPPFL